MDINLNYIISTKLIYIAIKHLVRAQNNQFVNPFVGSNIKS